MVDVLSDSGRVTSANAQPDSRATRLCCRIGRGRGMLVPAMSKDVSLV